MELLKSLQGGFCAFVWDRDLGLPSEVGRVEPNSVTGTPYIFGVGVRYPNVSLMMEADAFPVVWLDRIKCIVHSIVNAILTMNPTQNTDCTDCIVHETDNDSN